MLTRIFLFLLLALSTASAQLKFAVSGDSRNCGDIVMPMIAADATKNGAEFYLHLGDLRALFEFDEDMRDRPGMHNLNIADYEAIAWQDFIDNQIAPWGSTPFYLGIGNHELINKSRQDFIIQFADWLGAPVLQRQRLLDNPKDHSLKTYFHWIQGGVDFIYLDNASYDKFDDGQMKWLQQVLQRAGENQEVRSIMVGMHAVLPDSLASSHSMNDWVLGDQSGHRVYASLVQFKAKTHKPVYLLASHSHFYMVNVFNTEAIRSKSVVLPGWIIGTAGAYRYKLPPTASQADKAVTGIYGYMLGSVAPSGEITFEFREMKESDVPAGLTQKFGKELIDFCFKKNKDQ